MSYGRHSIGAKGMAVLSFEVIGRASDLGKRCFAAPSGEDIKKNALIKMDLIRAF